MCLLRRKLAGYPRLIAGVGEQSNAGGSIAGLDSCHFILEASDLFTKNPAAVLTVENFSRRNYGIAMNQHRVLDAPCISAGEGHHHRNPASFGYLENQ